MTTKKHSHDLKVDGYLIPWACLGLWARETATQSLCENCSKEAGGEVRLHIVLQQREQTVWSSKVGIKLRNFTFCVWNMQAHWVHSFHVHLSYLGPILFPCLPGGVTGGCLSHSPNSLVVTMEGVAESLGHSLGSAHSHLEARNCWWLWYFLFIDTVRDIFISHLQSSFNPSQVHSGSNFSFYNVSELTVTLTETAQSLCEGSL